MNSNDLKNIAENLIETFQKAGDESIKIQKQNLKITIKEDDSPVTNGDLRVKSFIFNGLSKTDRNFKYCLCLALDLI